MQLAGADQMADQDFAGEADRHREQHDDAHHLRGIGMGRQLCSAHAGDHRQRHQHRQAIGDRLGGAGQADMQHRLQVSRA